MTEQEIIQRCREQDPTAQKCLYDRFAPKMMGVSKRYIQSREDAEDVLVEAMYKALSQIEKYRSEGSFEGWIRRIVVNEALMFLRKRHQFVIDTNQEITDYSNHEAHSTPTGVEAQMAASEIMLLLQQLPTGYRTVFNLYVIEGFKHIEIAEMLGISINTSKSQLILAREKLQKMILQQQKR